MIGTVFCLGIFTYVRATSALLLEPKLKSARRLNKAPKFFRALRSNIQLCRIPNVVLRNRAELGEQPDGESSVINGLLSEPANSG